MKTLAIWTIVVLGASAGRADEPANQDKPEAAVGPVGYADEDRDGRNDRFRDADGDGVDEVSGSPYPHQFPFQDEDGDLLNDHFRDLDGDGVNDLSGAFADADGDGICDNVIDANGDGKNDITGRAYSKTSLEGFRFGRVEEERAKVHSRFRDRDGDGMNDLLRSLRALPLAGDDLFIDEDGDGISDIRRLRLRDQARVQQLKKLREQMRRRRAKPPPKERPRARKPEESPR
jgi:hypothetical protein